MQRLLPVLCHLMANSMLPNRNNFKKARFAWFLNVYDTSNTCSSCNFATCPGCAKLMLTFLLRRHFYAKIQTSKAKPAQRE